MYSLEGDTGSRAFLIRYHLAGRRVLSWEPTDRNLSDCQSVFSYVNIGSGHAYTSCQLVCPILDDERAKNDRVDQSATAVGSASSHDLLAVKAISMDPILKMPLCLPL
jgi:hypothetical protein